MIKLFNKLVFGTTSSLFCYKKLSFYGKKIGVGFDRFADTQGPYAGIRLDQIKVITIFWLRIGAKYKQVNLFSV
jgi:hypothetical protein